MNSLDQAVEKFRRLKQKLRNISDQSSKPTPTFAKCDKQNQKNTQNVCHPSPRRPQLALPVRPDHPKANENERRVALETQQPKGSGEKKVRKSKEKLMTVGDDNTDNKTLTQKKSNHRKNNSQNLTNKQIICDTRQEARHPDCKMSSLNSSRLSDTVMRKQLNEKEKTLGEINDLLQRKKEVLEALEKKIGSSFLDQSKLEGPLARSKRSIRAPNLFQMQAEGRKRSKSRTLTIRWK